MGICATHDTDLDSEYYALYDFSQRVENKETDLRYFERLSRFFDPFMRGELDFGDFLTSIQSVLTSMSIYMNEKSGEYKTHVQIVIVWFLKDFSSYLKQITVCIKEYTRKFPDQVKNSAMYKELILLIKSAISLAREYEQLTIASKRLSINIYRYKLRKLAECIDFFMRSLG